MAFTSQVEGGLGTPPTIFHHPNMCTHLNLRYCLWKLCLPPLNMGTFYFMHVQQAYINLTVTSHSMLPEPACLE